MGVLRHTVTGHEGGTIGTRWRPAVAGMSLVAAAGLAAAGCGSSSNSGSSAPACFSKAAAAAQAGTAVTNNVVFTTTYSGDLYAFNTATGAILLKTRLPARTNAPVTINGDYVITAGSVAQSAGQRMFIVAYRLGATGKLPGSAGS